jgi:hypothetical protein
MDIRTVTQAEKEGYISRVLDSFEDIRKTLITLTIDMTSEDLVIQASSVWIGGQLCNWWSDFIAQIKKVDRETKSRTDLENELKDAVNDNTTLN